MGDRDRMQRAFQGALPEQEEFLQLRKLRAEIVVLPDVALEQPGMDGTAIEDVRRGQPVAIELLLEIGRYFVVEPGHDDLQPGGLQCGSDSLHCKPKS